MRQGWKPIAALLGALLALPAIAQGQDGAYLEPSAEVANPEEVPVPADPPAEDDGCYPPCRKAFTCYQGACVSLCNPPCPEGEHCTEQGECEPTAPPESAQQTSEADVWPSTDPPPPAPSEPPPFANQGLQISAGVGLALCAIGGGTCDSFDKQDLGPDLAVSLGYRASPWVAPELGFVFSYIFPDLDDSGDVEWERHTAFWLAAQFGLRAYPFGGRHTADLVLGLHASYIHWRAAGQYTRPYYSSSMNAGDSGTSEHEFDSWRHAFGLDVVLGLAVHLTHMVSLGFDVTLVQPYWIETCAVEKITLPDMDLEHDSCQDYEGDYHDVLINLNLALLAVFG